MLCEWCLLGEFLINQYWVGSNQDYCAACNSGCSLGCISASLTCYLCDDIRCKICTDYTAGTCIQCFTNARNINYCVCRSGFYWNAVTETCHSTCATCSSYGFVLCDTCVSGYLFLNGVCFPTVEQVSQNPVQVAVRPKVPFLNNPRLNPRYNIRQYILKPSGNRSNFHLLPKHRNIRSISIKIQWYYFSCNSIMKLPATAKFTSPTIKLSSSFTISTWTFLLTDGTLLAVQSLTYSNSFKITLTARPLLNTRRLRVNIFLHFSNFIGSYWNYIAFYIKLDSSGSTKASCKVYSVIGTLYMLSQFLSGGILFLNQPED